MTRATNIYVFVPRFLSSLVALMFLIAATSGSGQDSFSKRSPIEGVWILKSIYKTQNATGVDGPQQKSLLNSRISYKSNSLTSCKQSVPIATVEINERSTRDLFADTNVGADELKLSGAKVTEVIFNKTQSGNCFGTFTLPGEDVYIKGKNELIINFVGVFYRAVRE